jgi:EF hand
MDKDKDGSISREEAKGTALEKDFAKMEKNNDGKLSQSEVTAGAGAGATSGSTPPKKSQRRSLLLQEAPLSRGFLFSTAAVSSAP